LNDADHPIDAWVRLPPTEIVATVARSAVPQIPFAALRGSLVAEYDDDGALVDWTVTASALEDPEAVATYWAWRRRWQPSWPIGPISNLAGLVRVADEIGHPLGPAVAELLDRLITAEGEPFDWTLDDDEADGVLAQLDELRAALADTIEAGPGAGIVDDTPGPGRSIGLARTWVPDDVELVLAATSTLAVVVRPGDGLVVLHEGPRFRSFPWVSEVDLAADPVVVTDDEGHRLELDPEQARPLAWLVPRALRWHVRTIPLVTVWTALLMGLPEAIAAARAAGCEITFTGQVAVR
jgi:hypothetical protein